MSRADLLKSFKIKKKGSTSDPPKPDDKPTSRPPNMHINPARAAAVSPLINTQTSSSTSAISKATSDPKPSESSNRDPRIPKIKTATFTKASTKGPSPLADRIVSSSKDSKGKSSSRSSIKSSKGVEEELFKPDPINKSKIKIDLSTETKVSSRDPRIKKQSEPTKAVESVHKKDRDLRVGKEEPKPTKTKEERIKEIKNELRKSEKRSKSSSRAASHSPKKSEVTKAKDKDKRRSEGKPSRDAKKAEVQQPAADGGDKSASETGNYISTSC